MNRIPVESFFFLLRPPFIAFVECFLRDQQIEISLLCHSKLLHFFFFEKLFFTDACFLKIYLNFLFKKKTFARKYDKLFVFRRMNSFPFKKSDFFFFSLYITTKHMVQLEKFHSAVHQLCIVCVESVCLSKRQRSIPVDIIHGEQKRC